MTPTEQMDKKIAALPKWQADIIVQFRNLLEQSFPDAKPEWKWSTGMWSMNGKLVCGFGAFKEHVKLNFFKGAYLNDANKLFNNGFDAKDSRSIDVRPGEAINETALAALIRNAMDYTAK